MKPLNLLVLDLLKMTRTSSKQFHQFLPNGGGLMVIYHGIASIKNHRKKQKNPSSGDGKKNQHGTQVEIKPALLG